MVRRAWRAVSLAVPLILGGVGACGRSASDDEGPNHFNVAGSGGTFGGGGGASAGSPPIVAGYTTCFEAGSLVATPDGSVPIEQLAIGDSVLAFDEHTGAVATRPVTATFTHEVQTTGRLALSDGRVLRVTAEHPIYNAGLGSYVPADSFDENSKLVTLRQSLAPRARSARPQTVAEPLASVALVTTASSAFISNSVGSPVRVFNISVEGLQNYFVEGVLVHNKSPPLCPPTQRMTQRMWPGGACESQAECIDPSNPEVEHVPLNQLVVAAGGAGGADNAAGGAPDTSSGGAPDASGGAPVQLGGAPGDASAGSPGAAGASPAAENAAVSVPVCAIQAALAAPLYLAVDYRMPQTQGGTPGFAIYLGGQVCSGVELAQVWLNDAVPPPPGSLTTQCVDLQTLSATISVYSLHPAGEVTNLRFASSCEFPRGYSSLPIPAPNPFPCVP